ncbi:GNAT family N-acetyltransferase [Kineococcus sp. SYSU DK006]|uniref:GNAT family N-acetyltransferase n=1 Tax=Kineococcus sp. SYSU DK006 TaxID=3383127 RepID=UPI003D7F0BB5
MPAPAQPDDVGADLDAWVRGWVLARGVSGAVRTPHWWRVPTGTDTERCRWVLTTPSAAAVREAVAEARAETDHVKTAGDPAAWLPRLGPGWRPEQPTWLMTTPLAAVHPPAAPPGYRLATSTAGATTVLTVHAADGTPAARGHLAVAGADAVFDRISTEAQHRRRGLGSLVMTHLAAAARAGGARRGVLVASAQGRALYTSLGWRTRSPITGAHRHLGTGAVGSPR